MLRATCYVLRGATCYAIAALRCVVRAECENGARLRPRAVAFVAVSASETHYIGDIAPQIASAVVNPIRPAMFRSAQWQRMRDWHLLYRLSLVSPRLFPDTASRARHADYYP